MNKFLTFLKRIFSKKNNLLFFILSLIISSTITVSLSSSRVNTRKEFADYLSFPKDYSYLVGTGEQYQNFLDTDFTYLDYSVLRQASSGLEVNLSIENVDFVVVGVEEDFLNYPLPDFNKNIYSRTLQKLDIIEGKTFDSNDILAQTKVVIMNEYFLRALNYQGEDIFIGGEAFKLKGVLNNSSSIERYQSNGKICAPIYVPYTTLKTLLNTPHGFEYSCVVKTNGFRFRDYEDNDGPKLISKYSIEYEMVEYEKNLTRKNLPIVCSLIAISFVATFIVQYIMIRNKHFEIGIKRAIGASRVDIIYEFLVDFALVTFIAIVLGLFIGISITILINLYTEILYKAPLIIIDMNSIGLTITVYYLFTFFASFLSIYLGTKINISSIIVEER